MDYVLSVCNVYCLDKHILYMNIYCKFINVQFRAIHDIICTSKFITERNMLHEETR